MRVTSTNTFVNLINNIKLNPIFTFHKVTRDYCRMKNTFSYFKELILFFQKSLF